MIEGGFKMTLEDRIDFFKLACVTHGLEDISVERLIEMGYFTAPSSAKHHGVYEGGNFDHSRTVTEFLLDLTAKGIIKWQDPRSPWVVGMFHDLCKVDKYEAERDELGNITGWKYSDDEVLSGHGEKSIMLLSQFLQLTEEEVLCIRYHMGAYEKDDWNGYDKAIRKYPTVLWTHTADMYASKVIGV